MKGLRIIYAEAPACSQYYKRVMSDIYSHPCGFTQLRRVKAKTRISQGHRRVGRHVGRSPIASGWHDIDLEWWKFSASLLCALIEVPYPSHPAFSQSPLGGRLSEAFLIPCRLSRDVTPCALHSLLRKHGLIPDMMIQSLILNRISGCFKVHQHFSLPLYTF